MGSNEYAVKIRGVMSTQCPVLDGIIGRGGVPFGRLTIIHGPESSGKTTLALHLVAECQHRGGVAMYIDKEYKLDPDYARKIGVNTDDLVISQPPYLEKVFQIVESVVLKARAHREQTGVRIPILVVLDSMNAAISKADFDGEWEDQTMAAAARVFSQKLPKIIPTISQEDVALVFISQIRQKVGVMYGPKEDIAGGRGPKFYSSLILDVRKKGMIKDGDEIVGQRTEVYVGKNQIAKPFQTGEFDIYFGHGIDRVGALIERATTLGIVKQAGPWISWGDEKLGQGLKKAIAKLEENAELKAKIEAELIQVEGWMK